MTVPAGPRIVVQADATIAADQAVVHVYDGTQLLARVAAKTLWDVEWVRREYGIPDDAVEFQTEIHSVLTGNSGQIRQWWRPPVNENVLQHPFDNARRQPE